jgi:glutaredoxin 3
VQLLRDKDLAFTEIDDAAFDAAKKRAMVERANGRATFPQIFIGEQHVGGCDDLMALERAGKLDQLLAA